MPFWLQEWWPAIVLVLTLAIGPGLRWIVRKGLVSQEGLADMLSSIEARRAADQNLAQRRFEDHGRRIVEIESRMRGVPSTDEIRDFNIHLARVEGKLDTFNERTDGLEKFIDRLDDTVRRHEAIFADAARRR
jgi:hypothetical protein